MKPVNGTKAPETEPDDPAATNVVLSTLLENLPVGVLVEDADREIIAVNPALCEIIGIEREPAELVGRNCARAAEELQDLFADPERFLARIETVLDRREPVSEEELRLADGRTLERTYVPYTLPDGEANLWLYRDATERREKERRLEKQNERLEAVLAALSHDLRNPLNVATANLRLADEEGDSDRLDAVSEALDRMDVLIEDVLVLAREEEAIGGTEPVNVGELARECWSYVETPAAALDVDADHAVRADRSRLTQVFENLFRNAVEHGGAGVEVTVGAVSDGFYVEDDGRGVPPDERERIFETAYSTSAGGTGLGLRIVETIVDAHGWEIELAEARSGGTRFEITDIRRID